MTHDHSGTIEELAQELLERRDGVKRLLEELLNAFPRKLTTSLAHFASPLAEKTRLRRANESSNRRCS